MPNPEDYYGKQIAWKDLIKDFPDHYVYYSDVDSDSPYIYNAKVVPRYIVPADMQIQGVIAEFAKEGINCNGRYTAEVGVSTWAAFI